MITLWWPLKAEQDLTVSAVIIIRTVPPTWSLDAAGDGGPVLNPVKNTLAMGECGGYVSVSSLRTKVSLGKILSPELLPMCSIEMFNRYLDVAINAYTVVCVCEWVKNSCCIKCFECSTRVEKHCMRNPWALSSVVCPFVSDLWKPFSRSRVCLLLHNSWNPELDRRSR